MGATGGRFHALKIHASSIRRLKWGKSHQLRRSCRLLRQSRGVAEHLGGQLYNSPVGLGTSSFGLRQPATDRP